MRGSHAVYFLLTGMPLPPSNFRVKLKMIVYDVDGGSGGSDDDGDCLLFLSLSSSSLLESFLYPLGLHNAQSSVSFPVSKVQASQCAPCLLFS